MGIFCGGVGSICARFANFDVLALGCEISGKDASLALLFQR